MKAGARVEVAPYKRDSMDFVLWKPSKEGEPAWPSPSGIAIPGRPGWHIECSAMSDRWLWTEAKPHLSERGLAHPHQFDIHGGGIDLVFPHHENEIAQSRCAFHTPVMANYWMHNGFLQVEGEKMSKSLGNFFTIRDVLGQMPNDPRWGEVVRLNMLKTHYRQPLDWTQAGLHESLVTYGSFRQVVIGTNRNEARLSESVLAALADDLNTPAVIAELHRIAAKARSSADAAAELVGSLLLLGFDRAVDHVKADDSVREDVVGAYEEVSAREAQVRAFQEDSAREARLDPIQLDALVTARNAARKVKNFKEADRIRDELKAMGVELEDKKDGRTLWKVK